jgi:hypothetical protein
MLAPPRTRRYRAQSSPGTKLHGCCKKVLATLRGSSLCASRWFQVHNAGFEPATGVDPNQEQPAVDSDTNAEERDANRQQEVYRYREAPEQEESYRLRIQLGVHQAMAARGVQDS